MEKKKVLEIIAYDIYKEVKRRFPFGGGKEGLSIGADGDVTRLIDKVAEDAAFQSMDEMGIDWNVYSEEAGEISHGSDHTLIIDPIDGTHNAMWNIPVFSTSLGLLDNVNSEITHGVIINIPTGEVFSAIKGRGSEKDGKKLSTRSMDLEKAVVSSYIGPEAKGWIESLIFWPRRTRYFGCISLELCMVASGSFDIFVMFGRIPRLTDIAAGSLILREAGGEVFLLDKENRVQRFEPDFRRDSIKAFFAVGDPTSLRRVLEISNLDFTMGDEEV